MIIPFANDLGELRYEGFLRLVTPHETAHAWLREAALVRGSKSSVRQLEGTEGVPPDGTYRLCQIFANEVDLNRRLLQHRKKLHDLGVNKDDLLKYLNSMCGTNAE